MAKEKLLKAIYSSDKTPLKLGNLELDCYVLEDGTRVFSGRGIQKSLGSKSTSGKWLTNFVNRKTISTYLETGVLEQLNNPIKFDRQDSGGSQPISYGYEVTLLIDICQAVKKAYKDRQNIPEQYFINADIITDATSKVGIISLVDEKTGYQHERENDALQLILNTLVSDKISTYQKQFQLSFYEQIFKLWKIPFTEANIKRKPQFIGHLTNKYVYSNLPAGSFVLEKLKSKTPKTAQDNYKYRLHQSLTDLGKEALKKVLYTVEALAFIARDKKDFDRLINERYGQKELPFSDLDRLAVNETDEFKNEELSKFNNALAKTLDKSSE